MGIEAWVAVIGCVGTLLLVLVGLLNFSIFFKQLAIAREQISTGVRQLEIAQKAPDLHFIPRSITDTSDHIRVLLDKPYLRKYFYESVEWQEGDSASLDEVKLVSELMLNNFVSSIMHSAAFPQYPVRGIDKLISYHLRRGPGLWQFFTENFERFPFSGLTLLCLKAQSPEEVEMDLQRLVDAPGLDAPEKIRRAESLRLFRESPGRDPFEFAALSMQRRH